MLRSRAVAATAVTLIALVLSRSAVAGVVVTRQLESAALARTWTYAVYLPNGYATSKLTYPVLYLLHGNGGNLFSWANDGKIQATADALIASGDIPP
ncbi:MAG: alpha/beta hydrolase-fold protein, partial [Betaproteobacteria bacterium]